MILNPLTGKMINPNGSTAKKLLQKHKSGHVKLSTKTLKVIKQALKKQQRGGSSEALNKVKNIISYIIDREHYNPKNLKLDITFNDIYCGFKLVEATQNISVGGTRRRGGAPIQPNENTRNLLPELVDTILKLSITDASLKNATVSAGTCTLTGNMYKDNLCKLNKAVVNEDYINKFQGILIETFVKTPILKDLFKQEINWKLDEEVIEADDVINQEIIKIEGYTNQTYTDFIKNESINTNFLLLKNKKDIWSTMWIKSCIENLLDQTDEAVRLVNLNSIITKAKKPFDGCILSENHDIEKSFDTALQYTSYDYDELNELESFPVTLYDLLNILYKIPFFAKIRVGI